MRPRPIWWHKPDTRELQRDLLRTRMIEFDGISERLYRVVRQAAKEVGKQVRLDLKGGSIEMDRGVLDRMTPAFEHLLRNCVVHGIELPQDRQARDKDPVGTITIELRQEGNDVSVIFSDDGQGLDLARIRSKAQSLGLIAAEDELDAHQTAQLVFLPGLSTAAEVSELAGRGIGLDVETALVIVDGTATREAIMDGLDWLQREVTQHDVGMLFVAGHGDNDAELGYIYIPHNFSFDAKRRRRPGAAQS